MMRFMLLALASVVIGSLTPSLAGDDLASCMNENAAPDAAVDACTRAIERAQTTKANVATLYEWRARAREKTGAIDRAVADYSEAIRINPGAVSAYQNRAALFFARREYARVIADWSEVARIDPKNAAAFINRGAARYLSGDLDGAIVDYDAALSLAPDNGIVLSNRGAAWRDKGDLSRAFADLDCAIQIDPKNARAWHNRALAWKRKGDLDRAIEDDSQALGLDPKLTAALTERGLAYERKGDASRARADFNAAVAAPLKYYDSEPARQTALGRLAQISSTGSATGGPSSKSIALIIDASGSMNAKLPEGRTRIEAAKAAVEDIVGKLPADVRISLRAYGHQSPTSKRDCRDTALLVAFDTLAAAKDGIIAKTRGLKAQGYTPITYVLKLAAEDVGKDESKPRIVILVSDGKETCEGDPCATAKALADADASLVIHTIGFAVDNAAKYQLQCIARVARGKYWDADGTGRLAAALGEAAKPAPLPPERKTTEIVVTRPKPGRLVIRNAEMGGHTVSNAETNAVVATLNSAGPSAELPAGIYNVVFGKSVWKGVEVRSGETTTLAPGVIEIQNADIGGHKVFDNETGEEIGSILSSNPRLTVLPSTFAVSFGKALWKDIEVKDGERKVLEPGVIAIVGADIGGHRVFAEDGAVVATIMSSAPRAALPPGKYSVEIGAQKVPVELAAGQTLEIKVK
jgi:tetratricopeptide (TPR) repeat protein